MIESLVPFEKGEEETGIYELVGIYEKYIRSFIMCRLKKQAPIQWYKKYVEKNIENTDLGRINKIFRDDDHRENEHLSLCSNPLQYYDYKHYPIIVEKVLASRQLKKLWS